MRMMHLCGALLISCGLLVGCTTVKTMEPIGGSRADGTVKLAFTYGMFETPNIDWEKAQQSAVKRCKAWGYTDAEKFGGKESKCIQNSGGACIEHQVDIQYQCTNPK